MSPDSSVFGARVPPPPISYDAKEVREWASCSGAPEGSKPRLAASARSGGARPAPAASGLPVGPGAGRKGARPSLGAARAHSRTPLPWGAGLRGLRSGLPESRTKSFFLFIKRLAYSCLDSPAGLTLPTLGWRLGCLNLPAQTPQTRLWVQRTPGRPVFVSPVGLKCVFWVALTLLVLCFYSTLLASEEPLCKSHCVP